MIECVKCGKSIGHIDLNWEEEGSIMGSCQECKEKANKELSGFKDE